MLPHLALLNGNYSKLHFILESANIRKLASKIKGPNFFQGTVGTDIKTLFKDVYKKEVDVDSFLGDGVEIRDFVVEQIKEDNPVMLGIIWPEGAHWVTVVGLDYAGENDNKDLWRFLVIDPGGNDMQFCSWNGVIDAKGSGGRYPYGWWGQDQRVKLDEAVVIKAKRM